MKVLSRCKNVLLLLLAVLTASALFAFIGTDDARASVEEGWDQIKVDFSGYEEDTQTWITDSGAVAHYNTYLHTHVTNGVVFTVGKSPVGGEAYVTYKLTAAEGKVLNQIKFVSQYVLSHAVGTAAGNCADLSKCGCSFKLLYSYDNGVTWLGQDTAKFTSPTASTATKNADFTLNVMGYKELLVRINMIRAVGGTRARAQILNFELKNDYADEQDKTVTFINGGAEYGSTVANQGTRILEPAEPGAPAGKLFVGWFDDDGKKWDFDRDVVIADTTLTAVFNDEVSVRFFVGENLVYGQAAPSDTIITFKPADPEPQGDRFFTGWSLPDGTDWDFENDKLAGDTDLYARFQAKQEHKSYFDDTYRLNNLGLTYANENIVLVNSGGVMYAQLADDAAEGYLLYKLEAPYSKQFKSLDVVLSGQISLLNTSVPNYEAVQVFVSQDNAVYVKAGAKITDSQEVNSVHTVTITDAVKDWSTIYIKLVFTFPAGHTGSREWVRIYNTSFDGVALYKDDFGITYHGMDGAAYAGEGNPAGYNDLTPTFSLNSPEKYGYTFDGWYGDKDYGGQKITQVVIGSWGDLELYAKWTAKTVTVTFDANGGSFGEETTFSTTAVFDSVIPASAVGNNPQRTGFTFIGWYLEPECTNKFELQSSHVTGMAVDSETPTLYAGWDDSAIAVTFKFSDEVTEDYTVFVSGGDTVAAITPVRAGYAFNGWYTAANVKYVFSTPVTTPLTLTASWSRINTITYLDTGGAENLNPTSYLTGTGIITLTGLSRNGYTFLGWFDQEGDLVTTVDKSVEQDITLYARFDAAVYNITLIVSDNVLVSPADVTQITYDGLTFTFTPDVDYGVRVRINNINADVHGNTLVLSNITADVKLEVIAYKKTLHQPDYTVNYAVYGNEDGSCTVDAYNYERIVTYQMPDGLGNWMTNSHDGVGNFSNGYIEYKLTAGENKTYKTMRLRSFARVFYYAADTSALRFYISVDGGEYILLKDFDSTANGAMYTDVDFVLNDYVRGHNNVVIRIEIEADYWGWVAIRYLDISAATGTVDVGFYDGDTVLYLNELHGEGEPLVFIENPVKPGYTFLGWVYRDGGVETPATEGVELYENTKLYSTWRANDYGISYVLDGGTNAGTNPSSFTFGATVSIAVPTRANYSFGGWYLDAGFTGERVHEVGGIPQAVTLYAKWLRNYSITYILYGGTNGGNPATYTVEDSVELLPAERDGWQFVGWYNSQTGGLLVTEIAPGITGALILHARWVELPSAWYKITYVLGGGTNSPTNPAMYQSSAGAVISAPEKTGYKFAGWFAAADFSGDAVTSVRADASGEITLYAKWTTEFGITYVLNGGVNGANPEVYDSEEGLTLIAATKAGYKFDGWYLDEDFSGSAVTEIEAGTAEDIFLYAKWTKQSSGGCGGFAAGGILPLLIAMAFIGAALFVRKEGVGSEK